MGFTVNEMDSSLRDAIFRDELVYYYQPKVDLLTGRVCGAEALIRWKQPGGEVILPNDFIPAAEISGFIRELSFAMFDRLVSDVSVIREINPDLVVSFNLTAKDFTNDHLVDKLAIAIVTSQIDPTRLQIELTETSLLNVTEGVQTNIQRVVDLGINLAMDDFGTGYSSIDVLSQWPFSIVKIDQGLVSRMQNDEKNAVIVRNSIHLAHQLGLKILAEGVETEEVYGFLLKAGCSEVQGFLLGRPMPLDEFRAFLRADKKWSGSPIGLIHMAQADHLQWRRYLIDYSMARLYGEPSLPLENNIHMKADPHLCLLGQWYYGAGRAYSGIQAYEALEIPHNRLHSLCDDIRQALDQKKPRHEVLELLREMTNTSGEVISLLQDLELDALVERGQGFI